MPGSTWTAPSTWAAGAVLTEAQLNQQLRDNMLAIGNPNNWAAYTPSWVGSTTNPVIGNGSLLGRYLQIGKVVFFRVEVTMGSTTTYGAGNYTWQMPVTANTSVNTVFSCRVLDASANTYLLGAAVPVSTTTFSIATHGTTAVATPTIPITWALSDAILVQGVYEAA